MNSRTSATIGELVVVGGTIALCGFMVTVGSAYAGSMLDAMYNGSFKFDLVTHMARNAVIWAPILYGILLLAVFTVRLRFHHVRWVTWASMCIAALAAAITLYGIVKPFASTTFGLGTQ